MNKKRNLLYYSAAVIIPIIIALVFFSKLGLFPFKIDGTSKTLLLHDLWLQYFPFYIENYDNVRSFGSGVWSWDSLLGFNLFAQEAYYTHTIFNVFFYIVGHDSLQAVLHYVTILRFGVASLAFCIFLRYKFNKLDVSTVAFGSVYAFCAYMLAFVTQPMWIDMVILLPIVILGLEQLILKQKPILYCLTLFYSIWTNYYIAYSLCIFIVLYFIWYIIAHSDILKSKKIKKAIKYFVIFSVIGGALAAFELIPVLQALRETTFESIELPKKAEYYNHFTEIFAKLLPDSKFTIVWQVPNIYSGIITLLLVPLFFTNGKFSLRKKISALVFILFLIASFNNNILQRVWHAMHYPNQLNGRWTFMFSFFLIMLAYETFVNLKHIKVHEILSGLAVSVLIVLVTGANTNEEYIVPKKVAQLTLFVLSFYTILFLVLKRIKIETTKKIVTAVLAFVVVLEVGINTSASFTRKKPEDPKYNLVYNFPNYSGFAYNDDSMKQFKDLYGVGDNDFYRSEINADGLNCNTGQVYDYKGIAYYASNLPSAGYEFLKNVGYGVYATDRSIIYNPSFAILNTMLNVKYVNDLKNNLTTVGLEQVYDGGNFKVLENKYYLPLAFRVDDDILNWQPDENLSSIINQNSFANAAVGENLDIYTPILENSIGLGNVEFQIWTDGKTYYHRLDPNHKVTLDYTYRIAKSGMYLIKHGMKVGVIGTLVNGYNTVTVEVNDGNQVLDVGYLNEGDELIIHFEREGTEYGLFELQPFLLDEEKLGTLQSKLASQSAQIISAGDTKISMKLPVETEGLVYTSIPAVNGWEVKVNGKKVETYKVGGYLLAFNAPKGNNTVEIKYHLPGLGIGLVISILFALLLIAYIATRKFQLGTKFNVKILKSLEYKKEVEFAVSNIMDTNYIDTTFRDFTFESDIIIDYEILEEVLRDEADVNAIKPDISQQADDTAKPNVGFNITDSGQPNSNKE
ncbi:copper ABC transporter permease [Clostridia bacterium]|nr:copper ABC transporter permease [Clostridia bacterium]